MNNLMNQRCGEHELGFESLAVRALAVLDVIEAVEFIPEVDFGNLRSPVQPLYVSSRYPRVVGRLEVRRPWGFLIGFATCLAPCLAFSCIPVLLGRE
jgi:hypothetical protein